MPTEFQKAMDSTLINLLNTFCFIDDILIASRGSITEHNRLVEDVIKRVEAEGLSLKLSKCEFSVKKIKWCGYNLNEDGYKPIHDKIQDILALKPPKTLKQLRSFRGSINSISKFIEGAHELTAAFTESLSAGNKQHFYWSEKQNTAFFKLIDRVAAITNNYFYSADRPTRLKCDASKEGLGHA